MLTTKDFETLSIRATAAYMFCCLENALEFYKLNGTGWRYLLSQMWKYTELSLEVVNGVCSFDTWEDWISISPLMPYFYNKLKSEGYKECKKDLRWIEITEEDYLALRNDYQQTNDVINNLCHNIDHGAMGQTWCGFHKTAEHILYYLQKVLEIMEENKIPLPDIEPFKKYPFSIPEYDEDTYGWGYAFDGTQYSKYVNSDGSKNIK